MGSGLGQATAWYLDWKTKLEESGYGAWVQICTARPHEFICSFHFQLWPKSTSQHLTSSDFHITTSLSFLPQDSALIHPRLPPDPVKGLRHRQRQNATSKPSKNMQKLSGWCVWTQVNLWKIYGCLLQEIICMSSSNHKVLARLPHLKTPMSNEPLTFSGHLPKAPAGHFTGYWIAETLVLSCLKMSEGCLCSFEAVVNKYLVWRLKNPWKPLV